MQPKYPVLIFIFCLLAVPRFGYTQTKQQLQEDLRVCRTSKAEFVKEIDELQTENKRLSERIKFLEANMNPLPANSAVGLPSGAIVPGNDKPRTYDSSNAMANAASPEEKTILVCRNFVDSLMRESQTELPYTFRFFDILFHTYTVDVKAANIEVGCYWKDDYGNPYYNLGNFQRVFNASQPHKQLLFATNGGMYNRHLAPQGLLISNGAKLQNIDEKRGLPGNFYLEPNGVFLIQKDNTPRIIPTGQFAYYENDTQHATQSGPMLVINGEINGILSPTSSNYHIRSGVGIIDDRYIVFIKTQRPATFYQLARVFKDVFGCKNALFLDGAISKIYSPGMKIIESDGTFGPIIGVFKH